MSSFPRLRLLSLALLSVTSACSPQKQTGTSFQLVAPKAKKVFLAGTFNGWNTTATPMHRNSAGWWEARVPLEFGYYSYKFIADGRWLPDPANTHTEPDGHNGFNSTLVINPGKDDDGPAFKDSLAAEARRLFLAGDFSAIEKEEAKLRESRARTSEGVWCSALFGNGLNASSYPLSEHVDRNTVFAQYDAWHAQFPKSITEPPARARALIGYAWQARGSDAGWKVKPESWRPFAEGLAAARQVLETADALPTRSSDWWGAMQNVALGQVWSREEYEQLFQEAIAHEPQWYDYYYSKAYWLFPRWNGKPGEWERFAAEAPAKYDPTEGMALYARLTRNAQQYFANIFLESQLAWPQTRQGFRDLAQQYPHSRWNLNSFCFYACLAGDRATAHQLFPQIGDSYNLEVWQNPGVFAAWKAWADPSTPISSITPLRSFTFNSSVSINDLAYLKDGRLLAGFGDGSLKIWAGTSGWKEVADLRHPITSLAVAPRADVVAVATGQNETPGAVSLVDIATGEMTQAIDGWHPAALAVAFSPDGSALVAVGGDYHQPGEARTFSLTTKEVREISWPPLPYAAVAVAYSPDGTSLAVNDNCEIRAFSLATNQVLFQAKQPLKLAGSDIAWSPDGKWLASGYAASADRTVMPGGVVIVSARDGTLRQPPLVTPGGIHTITFSPDGLWLAGAGNDETIYLWDAATGNLRRTFLPLNGFIQALSFSPDGRTLAAAVNNGKITLWSLPSTPRPR